MAEWHSNVKIRVALVIVILLSGLIGGVASTGRQVALAQSTCYGNSCCGWYPADWSYHDSFISAAANTRTCFSTTNTWTVRGYTHGAEYPGRPMSGGLRIYMEQWEALSGGQCTSTYRADSGWKYNITEFNGFNGPRSILCTGVNHTYVSHNTHYFGNGGFTTQTGNNQ